MNTDTAAGEKAYLTFLRSQVSAIQELLTSSSLTAEDQGNTAQALAALYAADDRGAAAPNASDADAAPAPAAACRRRPRTAGRSRGCPTLGWVRPRRCRTPRWPICWARR